VYSTGGACGREGQSPNSTHSAAAAGRRWAGSKGRRKNPEVEPYTYSVVCAWCRDLIELRTTSDPKANGEASHGICAECVKKIRKK
jgi:hypothetical protein